MKKIILTIVLLCVTLLFASCELDGPVSHYKIVVNDRLMYIPQENILEIETVNKEFAAVPCEKDEAIERFNEVCSNLQNYYDENRGLLIWDNLNFEMCLYNTTSDKGIGEGLLVKSRIITYRCE